MREVSEKIMKTEEPPDFPDDISPDCYNFLECCLKIDQEERYTAS
jgi:hypothetical protein